MVLSKFMIDPPLCKEQGEFSLYDRVDKIEVYGQTRPQMSSW